MLCKIVQTVIIVPLWPVVLAYTHVAVCGSPVLLSIIIKANRVTIKISISADCIS